MRKTIRITFTAIALGAAIAATEISIHAAGDDPAPDPDPVSKSRLPETAPIEETAGKKAARPCTSCKITNDNSVERGLAWLASRQQPDGGWGPGHVGPGEPEQSTVANTCITLQAFLRAGYGPDDANYAPEIRRGLKFVLGQIEQSNPDDLFITSLRDTQLQRKLGTYVDTFIAATVLPEFKGILSGKHLENRLEKNISTILAKMEAHQEEDGTWRNVGWAPALAQSFASKGINKAAQFGYTVNEAVRQRAEKWGRDNFDAATGSFSDEGTAGVALYGGAANLSAINESAITNRELKPELEEKLARTADEAAKKEIRSKLDEIAACENDLNAARRSIVARLDDPSYVAGFGSNGGEEFLSYLNIGESLRLDGGGDWIAFRDRMKTNLERTQAQDGCWIGKHCITGGTFCTSTGLLVLMMDRAPLPGKAGTGLASTDS